MQELTQTNPLMVVGKVSAVTMKNWPGWEIKKERVSTRVTCWWAADGKKKKDEIRSMVGGLFCQSRRQGLQMGESSGVIIH